MQNMDPNLQDGTYGNESNEHMTTNMMSMPKSM